MTSETSSTAENMWPPRPEYRFTRFSIRQISGATAVSLGGILMNVPVRFLLGVDPLQHIGQTLMGIEGGEHNQWRVAADRLHRSSDATRDGFARDRDSQRLAGPLCMGLEDAERALQRRPTPSGVRRTLRELCRRNWRRLRDRA